MPLATSVATTLAAVEGYLLEHEPDLIAFRRQLHAAPELSGQEFATTTTLEQRLRTAGLTPVRLESGTGLVCDITTSPGPIVVLRADIDALAMPDEKDVSYRSGVPGVAHACGHDVHTAVVLGAGMALYRRRVLDAVPGTVRLVFEPSEESVPGGAVEVIEAGWLDDVAAVFGLHCDPKVDVGRVGVRTGALTSAADMVEIEVRGPGGHTARPGLTVDLLGALGRVVTEAPELVQAGTAAGALRLVFGAVHAGDAANVIPTAGVLRGTVRTPDPVLWAQAHELVSAAIAKVLGPTGATWQINYRRGVPPVMNDPAATELLAGCARAALGPDAVVAMEQSWGGDSFAWYSQVVPGSYARLGVHDPAAGTVRRDLHTGGFDVDERAIGTGVRVLATTAVAMLGRLTG